MSQSCPSLCDWLNQRTLVKCPNKFTKTDMCMTLKVIWLSQWFWLGFEKVFLLVRLSLCKSWFLMDGPGVSFVRIIHACSHTEKLAEVRTVTLHFQEKKPPYFRSDSAGF